MWNGKGGSRRRAGEGGVGREGGAGEEVRVER